VAPRAPAARVTRGRVPLERAISKLGLASRTEARKLILAGRVRVHGSVCKDPERSVTPETAHIEIDGAKAEKAAFRLFMLNKPRGLITTRADEKGRATVFSLLEREGVHLIAVGRLDAATTGLLLLTNDTRLASRLENPESGVSRTYVVTVRGEVDPAAVARVLREGLTDGGEILRPDDVQVRKSSGKETHLVVRLSEGKNREIRRIFAALGHEVTKLKRVAYGRLELGDLEVGSYREVTAAEILGDQS
jgi:23S rRNA pseudouridine2605 synthase